MSVLALVMVPAERMGTVYIRTYVASGTSYMCILRVKWNCAKAGIFHNPCKLELCHCMQSDCMDGRLDHSFRFKVIHVRMLGCPAYF